MELNARGLRAFMQGSHRLFLERLGILVLVNADIGAGNLMGLRPRVAERARQVISEDIMGVVVISLDPVDAYKAPAYPKQRQEPAPPSAFLVGLKPGTFHAGHIGIFSTFL